MLKETLATNNPQFEGTYRLSDLAWAKTKHGKDYFRCKLSDKTASIASVCWDPSPDDKVADGTIYHVFGKLEDYKGSPQVKIETMNAVTSFNPSDFEKRTTYDIEEMWSGVVDLVATFESNWIRRIAENLLTDERYMTAFQTGPAATGMHHAFIGGLLEHTSQMLKMGDQLLKLPFLGDVLNRDLCLFGLLFHDFGKIFEYKQDGNFKKTLQGILVPHIPMVAAMIYAEAEKFSVPEIVRDHLMHVVLAHHGRIDYGSPVSMNIPEADFVHFIDHMHGNIFGHLQKIENEAKAGDEYIKGSFGQNTLVVERFSAILKRVEGVIPFDEKDLPF